MNRQIEREIREWNTLGLIDSLQEVLLFLNEFPRYYKPREEISIYQDCANYVISRLVKKLNLDWNEIHSGFIHNLNTSTEILKRCRNAKKKSEQELGISEFRNEFIYDLEKVVSDLEMYEIVLLFFKHLFLLE